MASIENLTVAEEGVSALPGDIPFQHANAPEPSSSIPARVEPSSSALEIEGRDPIISGDGKYCTVRVGSDDVLIIPPEVLADVELLYRHNLLWARAQIFKHCNKGNFDWGDAAFSKSARDALTDYSKALKEYREYRRSGPTMFERNENVMAVGSCLSDLENSEKYLASETLGAVSEAERERRKREVEILRYNISRFWEEEVLRVENISGVTRTRKLNAKRAFYSRLIMAVVGGLALVVPMLIMTLHQSKFTSLLTTSLFVLAVAIGLACFMNTAEPKDIMGATAAYAAVLVVFVGAVTTTSA